MQTAWRPLDSVTGYFRGVAMFLDRIIYKLGAAHPPLDAIIVNARNQNLARAAAFFLWGNGGIVKEAMRWWTGCEPKWKPLTVTPRVNPDDTSRNSGKPTIWGWKSPGFPFLFFELNFFIYLHGVRFMIGREFYGPRPFLLFQFFLRGKIMANPQKENGYTPIANDIMDALCKIRISGEEWQCLGFILRKTYGWNKTKDKISLSQFNQATDIKKQNVCRALNRLLSKKIITVIKKDNGITEYALQKDFDLWEPLSKKKTLINGERITTEEIKRKIRIRDGNKCFLCGEKNETHLLPVHHIDYNQTNYKDNNLITLCKSCHGKTNSNYDYWKETLSKMITEYLLSKKIKPFIKKDKETPQIVIKKETHKNKYKTTSTKDTSRKWSLKIKFLVEEYFKTLAEGQRVRFEKQRDKFHSCCDKLLRIDGFSEEEIRKAVNFARHDYFWSQNFLSFTKLRQKNKDGDQYIEVFLNKVEKQKKQSDTTPRMDPPPNSEIRRKNWLKMINERIGKELSVFEKKDLPKIKEKVDEPTFNRILSILKDIDEESDENEI